MTYERSEDQLYKPVKFWDELRFEIAILLYGCNTCCTEACLLVSW